jgi:hypothetical protein
VYDYISLHPFTPKLEITDDKWCGFYGKNIPAWNLKEELFTALLILF